jgi:hypothetical protein
MDGILLWDCFSLAWLVGEWDIRHFFSTIHVPAQDGHLALRYAWDGDILGRMKKHGLVTAWA